MVKISFKKTQEIRKNIIQNNKNKDSVFIEGQNNVLISVPHGVTQTRLGKIKVAEIGTIPLGYIIAKNTNSNIIIKTKNNFDDANFDENCNYKKRISKIIKSKNIKYIIDFHGLAKHRPMDINLGINLGRTIESNVDLFEDLNDHLSKQNFTISIDKPFASLYSTISAYFSRNYNIWTVQVEVNSAISNLPKNIEKFNLLINTFINWINNNFNNK